MSSYISIDGDIKSKWLPFKLGGDQHFTFKSTGSDGVGKMRLGICPISIEQGFNYDLINDILATHKDNTSTFGERITFNTILDSLPMVQIREFQPDNRLNQILSMAKSTLDGAKKTGQTSNPNEGVLKTLLSNMGKLSKALVDGKFWESVIDNFSGRLSLDTGFYSGEGAEANSLLKIPFVFYYCLMTSKNTAFYDLPLNNYKNMYQSDGQPGWDAGRYEVSQLGKYSGDGKSDKEKSKLEKLAGIFNNSAVKQLLNGVGINMVQWWDGSSEKGTQTPEPQISIEFDLFNDCLEHSIVNYIFINTIIPSNKWFQYNMFSAPPALYDIKLSGINRFFMCKAQFEVQIMGLPRSVNQQFLKRLRVYLGDHYKGGNMTQDLIRIPDVYHVKMTFQSMLPANFNQFLFSFAKNSTITNATTVGTKNAISEFIKSFSNEVKNYNA